MFELGVPAGTLPVETQPLQSVDRRSVYVVMCDGTVMDPKHQHEIEAGLRRGCRVLPVVRSLQFYSNSVPAFLTGLNGFQYWPPAAIDALADEVIAQAWLARRNRRVFLSYRRSEASALAYQLRDELARQRYDVFLDECTIDPGLDVQREIQWQLNDADMVLLLASPGVGSSNWVMQEITFAAWAGVALVALTWDKQPLVAGELWPDQKLSLAPGDFADSALPPQERTLTDDALERALALVNSQRLKAIHQRLMSLLPFAESSINPLKFDVQPGTALGDLVAVNRNTSEEYFVRVVPFRPTVETFSDLQRDLTARSQRARARAAFIFYSESNPTDPRHASMRWLLAGARPPSDASDQFALAPFDGSTNPFGPLA